MVEGIARKLSFIPALKGINSMYLVRWWTVLMPTIGSRGFQEPGIWGYIAIQLFQERKNLDLCSA